MALINDGRKLALALAMQGDDDVIPCSTHGAKQMRRFGTVLKGKQIPSDHHFKNRK